MPYKGLIFALLCSQVVIAADITWDAISPANDLNTAGNWSPATVPTNTDNALFNSSVPSIATNPTASADFSVLSLNFVSSASAFSFAFNNCNLTFTGIGIHGAQTNATVSLTNFNNVNVLFDQADFAGPSSSSGAAAFSFLNSGTATGTNTGVTLSSLSDAQLHSANEFTIASNGSLSFFNVGTDNSTDEGANHLAQVGSQAIFSGPVVVGNSANLSAVNSGTHNNTTSTTSNSDTIAKIPNDQLNINSLTAGNNLNLSVSNLGTNNSAGIGINEIGYVNSHQITIGSAQIGSNAVISLINNGANASSNIAVEQAIVGKIGGKQLNCFGSFVTGDSLALIAGNTGDDTSNSVGSGDVGNVDAQLYFGGSFTTGQSASITLINSGTNSMTSPSEHDPVIATSANPQMYVGGNFVAGKSLELTVTNGGTDHSSGLGGNVTGFIASSQFQTDGSFTVGDDAFLSFLNIGTKTGSSPDSSVGLVSTDQFLCGPFSAGNNLTIAASNTGINTGTNNGSIGFLQHDGLHFADTFNALNNATISVTNTGSNTQGSGVIVGSSQRFLFEADAVFTAGNNFNLFVSNSGTDTSGGANNIVGANIDGYEAYFASNVNLGKNATISVANSGSYSGTDTGCFIGFTQNQILFGDTFTAAENLSLTATNSAVNPNHVPNVGATINQIVFLGTAHFNDGTFLSVVNDGDGIVGNQMAFAAQFTLTGKATFQAINSPTGTAGAGIFCDACVGGDINVILQNTSLFTANSIIATPFTMGALNGDATSSAIGDPGFIINTDAGVNAFFAGSFSGIMGQPIVVIKDGPGTQTLSGTSTFDGHTTVQGGTLILNGSITCPLSVTALGTLKGTGSVGGAVVNSGTIAPGQSIGTINFLTTFSNNGGNYDVEVNSAGQSDLILVGGAATLNGGQVVVSTVDGTFRFSQPYTILQAASVGGAFTGATSAAFITPTLTYDPQHVFLTLAPNLARAATTSNQRAVAGQLDNLTNPTAAQLQLINVIANLPQGAARDALTSLSGYQHTFDLLTTGIINRQFIRRLYDPLRFIVTRTPDCCCDPCCCCNEFSIWLEGGGSHTHISGNQNAPGLNLNRWEITFGLQDTFCQNFTLGVAGSFDHQHYHFKKQNGSGHSNTWFVGAYGLYRPSCFYGLLDFAWGFSSNDLHRRINLGGFSTHATSHPNTHQFTFYGEMGVDFCACNLLLQPFIGVETNIYHRRKVREDNSNNWGLNVRHRERNSTFLRIGSHFTNTCQIPGNIDISVDIAWNGRLSCDNNKVRVQFNDFGTPFNVRGVKLGNSVDYAITFSTDYCCNWRFYLQGSGETWNHAQEFGYLAGIEYTW